MGALELNRVRYIAAGFRTTNDIEGGVEGIIRAYELPSERKVLTNSLAILWENPRVNLMTNVGLLGVVQSRTDICLTSMLVLR